MDPKPKAEAAGDGGGKAAPMTEENAEPVRSEALQWRPSLALLLIWVLGSALLGAGCGVGAAGVTFEVGGSPLSTFVHVAVGLWLVGAVLSFLHFRSLTYTLDDRYLTKVSGRLCWHRRAVPLDQITSLDVRRGPLERLAGIGQIWIFTPSTGDLNPQEKLVGVKAPDRVREAILRRAEEAKQYRRAAADALPPAELRLLLETIRDSLQVIRANLQPARSDALPPPDQESAPDSARGRPQS